MNMLALYTANAFSLAGRTVASPHMAANHADFSVQVTCAAPVARKTSVLTPTGDLAALGDGFAAMRALKDGWDGPGSVAPARELIDHAASILSFALKHLSFVEVPAIVPVADGGLQAEWYSSAYRFELYFDADGEIAAWSENRQTHVEMEEEGRGAIDMLLRWTSSLNDDRRFAA